jgi:hypothetical protein
LTSKLMLSTATTSLNFFVAFFTEMIGCIQLFLALFADE